MSHETNTRFNRSQTAKYAGISVPKARELIAAGEIRAFRLSTKVIRVEKADLDAWLASCVIQPKTEPAQAA